MKIRMDVTNFENAAFVCRKGQADVDVDSIVRAMQQMGPSDLADFVQAIEDAATEIAAPNLCADAPPPPPKEPPPGASFDHWLETATLKELERERVNQTAELPNLSDDEAAMLRATISEICRRREEIERNDVPFVGESGARITPVP